MVIIQDEREIEICRDVVAQLKAQAILEIGSASGGTLSEWLKAGARHLVSIDMDHGQLDRAALERLAGPGQSLHLITGDSGDPRTILRLDELMRQLGIGAFDAAYIDGGHSYEMVKRDFATCLPRTSTLLMFNDPVLVEVGQFIDELRRSAHPQWRFVTVINPNRRLPCAGEHTCGSAYIGETGCGNVLLFLTAQTRDIAVSVEDRVRRELAPQDPTFQPTRAYFHQRGLAQSPAYAAYWAGLYPGWGLKGHRVFRESAAWYRRSYEEQMNGRLELSLALVKKAERSRRLWWRCWLRALLRRLRLTERMEGW